MLADGVVGEEDAVPPGQELDDAFLDRRCGDVVRAMELIAAWLAGEETGS